MRFVGVANLPEGWGAATIGEMVESKVSQEGPTERGEFAYVDISSVDNATKRIESPRTLSDTEAPSRARQNLKAGDVLVSMTRPNLNAVALVPLALDGAVGSTGFDVLRTRVLDPRWIYYFTQTPGFVQAMSAKVQGALYPAIRQKDVREFPLPVPPLPEQRRIVEAIEANFARLEAGVAALELARSKLERYRASVLESVWMIGGTTTTQLGSLVTEHLCNGISIKGSDTPPGTPALRLSAMGENGFDYTDVRYLPLDSETARDLAIRADEFFISRGNGSLHLVGRGTVAQTPPRQIVYPDTMTRVRLDRSRVDPRWVALMWASRGVRRQIEARVKTTAGIFKISHPQMETILVPLPDLKVQASLVREVSLLLKDSRESLLGICGALTRSSALRQSILKTAFEGRLAAQDPRDESASALLERVRHGRAPAASSPSGRNRKKPVAG
ncbi:MAG: restriction endonuclease subunit S [Euryarchaeota archaeon]|nr:restriction endonuclease subunit S [Euryarchaeota archaeon]MDE1835958.1 restriction endonuclease subunit S [Euryarchaeota archaeon]MDE1881101.1 restriction endonuclease subunit S [Euryarchaeota archaeon]MDE2044364.1 restriction endonuclease subunit S [Thermoplasmata archaeon]